MGGELHALDLLVCTCRWILQEKYLKERIKVGGKAGNLGEAVKVTTEKSKIVIQVEVLHRPHPLHCPGQSPGPPLAHASTHTAQSASMKLRVP